MKSGRKSKIWTEETERFLIEHFNTMSNKQIADVLHTTRQYVNVKAKQLGLCSDKKCWKLTPTVKDAILRMYRTNSYKSIAEKLNISDDSVYLFIRKLREEDPTFQGRSDEEIGRLVSERRVRLLKVERAYAAFGLSQKTRVKLTRNSKKNILRYTLRKSGCYDVDYGSDEVYILNDEKRKKDLENEAVSYGFEFYEPVGEEGELTIYEKIQYK